MKHTYYTSYDGTFLIDETGRYRAKVSNNKDDFGEFKPPCGYYHYSNPQCQGALICQTANFPHKQKSNFEIHDGYTDRIQGWHPKGTDEAYKFLEGNIPYTLPTKSDEAKLEFCRLLFELKVKPIHMRAIYYYNLATGYDCPYIIAISEK